MAIAEKVLNEKIIPQIPVGRLGEPEEIARIVVFLASDDAGFITGSTISANGAPVLRLIAARRRALAPGAPRMVNASGNSSFDSINRLPDPAHSCARRARLTARRASSYLDRPRGGRA